MTESKDESKQWLTPEWSGDLLNKEEKDVVAILTERIRLLMAHDMDSLMSMLYRLDVEEQKVRQALSPDQKEDSAMLLACLIIDRQKRRMATRQNHGPDPSLTWIDI